MTTRPTVTQRRLKTARLLYRASVKRCARNPAGEHFNLASGLRSILRKLEDDERAEAKGGRLGSPGPDSSGK